MSKLYLVPTPVGNLGDMTYRAVEVLSGVDLILAEDTRTSAVLMKHYGIGAPMQPYHIYNEHRTLQHIIDQLLGGTTIALVTDAGTPAISDPGFLLAREAIANGIEVECLPGATAFVPALAQSGLPTDRFVFEGFLPHPKGRTSRLRSLATEQRTMIFYESPFRIAKTVELMSQVFGPERKASISREISKLHAETLRGTLAELAQTLASHPIKGEIVMIVDGLGKMKNERDG